ncbi:MAG: hypothetical protein KME18_09330 [Phormidium tanganyikae FI6-MK23]|nr:hypothetical protein [Phormidium tanganyikae FI6-MK23]
MKKLFFIPSVCVSVFALPVHAAPADWRNPKADESFAKEFSIETIAEMRTGLSSSPERDRSLEAREIIGGAIENDREKMLNAAALVCDARANYTPSYTLIVQTTRKIRDSFPQTHPLTARYVAMQLVNRGIRSYCPSLVDN